MERNEAIALSKFLKLKQSELLQFMSDEGVEKTGLPILAMAEDAFVVFEKNLPSTEIREAILEDSDIHEVEKIKRLLDAAGISDHDHTGEPVTLAHRLDALIDERDEYLSEIEAIEDEDE